MKDFIPVTQLIESPLLLVASSKLPVDSLKDLIALAKQKPGDPVDNAVRIEPEVQFSLRAGSVAAASFGLVFCWLAGLLFWLPLLLFAVLLFGAGGSPAFGVLRSPAL